MKKIGYMSIAVSVLLISVIGFGAAYASSNEAEKVIERVGRSGSVYTFKHNGNRCYVVENRGMNDSHSISCVRFEQ